MTDKNVNIYQELLHTPEGVRDYYGEENARKQHVSQAVLRRMHLFGYRDLQTPTFEFFDVFSREIGTTPSRDLYKFFDNDGNFKNTFNEFQLKLSQEMNKHPNSKGYEFIRDCLTLFRYNLDSHIASIFNL